MSSIGAQCMDASGRRKPPSNLLRRLVVSTLITMAAASCGNRVGNRDGKFVSIDREVIFSEFRGAPTAITRLTGGELVVTGKARTAWVFATDSQGALLWKYQDPVDERNSVQAQSQTEYHGMVPLANGNVLLCGQRNFEIGQKNLILILDRKGHVVEQREEVPGNGWLTPMSNFEKCIAWEGGALLLGTVSRIVSNESVYRQWMLTVDTSGKKIGEGFFTLTDVVAGDSHQPGVLYDFVDLMAGWRSWYLYRVSTQGKIVARREVILSQVGPVTTKLRAMEPTGNVQVIGVPLDKNPMMYTVNQRLEDVVPPREIYNIDTTQGMGYVRPDGSLALFGRTSDAAIAWVDSNGQLVASHVFNSKYHSYTIKDAVPVSATQFVIIRDGVADDPNDRGPLMDWVSFNRESAK